MARLLNSGVLPAGYYAVPFLDHEGPIEIDVAALREFQPASTAANGPQAWSPEAPRMTVAVEWPNTDGVRVEIFADEGDPRLVAAIELVSHRNKDRARARRAFVSKCANHLRSGAGVVIVDVVTSRRADLHAELMTELGVDSNFIAPFALSGISYRAVSQDSVGQLLVWPAELMVGLPLATLPLWLGGERAVPLDLEASHTAACVDLRIRQAG